MCEHLGTVFVLLTNNIYMYCIHNHLCNNGIATLLTILTTWFDFEEMTK